MRDEVRSEMRGELKNDVRDEMRGEIKKIKNEMKDEMKTKMKSQMQKKSHLSEESKKGLFSYFLFFCRYQRIQKMVLIYSENGVKIAKNDVSISVS